MSPGDEIQILHPDQVVLVGGEQVTVREFRFMEGLRVQAQAAPMLEDLAALLVPGASDKLEIEPLLEVFAAHGEIFEQLLAKSTGRSVEWVRGLSDEDGRTLAFAFWSANSGFFVRRLMTRVLSARLGREAGGGVNPGSATSTQH
jgi:hypothetical protein